MRRTAIHVTRMYFHPHINKQFSEVNKRKTTDSLGKVYKHKSSSDGVLCLALKHTNTKLTHKKRNAIGNFSEVLRFSYQIGKYHTIYWPQFEVTGICVLSLEVSVGPNSVGSHGQYLSKLQMHALFAAAATVFGTTHARNGACAVICRYVLQCLNK